MTTIKMSNIDHPKNRDFVLCSSLFKEPGFGNRGNFLRPILMISTSCNTLSICREHMPVYNDNCRDVPAIKPIRIFQVILAFSLLALTIYTIVNEPPYAELVKIALILIFGTYFFIALIDIISQLAGDPIPDTPMFLFGIVAVVLFLLAAFQIFTITRRYEVKEPWRVTMTMVLSMIASFVYLADILLIFLYGY